MSILIKGMEMPEYCYDCPCHNGESGYCQVNKNIMSIERPVKCPLIEFKDTIYRIIIRGKGAFKLMHCENCGYEGWFGAVLPKYCPECGAKITGVLE